MIPIVKHCLEEIKADLEKARYHRSPKISREGNVDNSLKLIVGTATMYFVEMILASSHAHSDQHRAPSCVWKYCIDYAV